MLVTQSFVEIRVYEGIAERTGTLFDRNEVRGRAGCCGSLTELIRKARAFGDGTFYLPLDRWPAETEQIPIRKPWVVMAS